MFRHLSLFAALLCLAFPAPSHAAGFWHGFQKHWSTFIAEQNGVVVLAVIVGIIGVLIICSGKWKR